MWPVVLLAGCVLEASDRLLDRQEPLQSPPRLVQQVGHAVPGLGDAGIVFSGRKIGDSRQQPEERRVGRRTIEREVTGVVPALQRTRRRQGRVAGVDPGALGVPRIDLRKGALVVERALNGAHSRVKHVGPDVEGITRDPVVGDDAVAPSSPERSEVAHPDGLDGAECISGNFSNRRSALEGYLAVASDHLEGREPPR